MASSCWKLFFLIVQGFTAITTAALMGNQVNQLPQSTPLYQSTVPKIESNSNYDNGMNFPTSSNNNAPDKFGSNGQTIPKESEDFYLQPLPNVLSETEYHPKPASFGVPFWTPAPKSIDSVTKTQNSGRRDNPSWMQKNSPTNKLNKNESPFHTNKMDGIPNSYVPKSYGQRIPPTGKTGVPFWPRNKDLPSNRNVGRSTSESRKWENFHDTKSLSTSSNVDTTGINNPLINDRKMNETEMNNGKTPKVDPWLKAYERIKLSNIKDKSETKLEKGKSLSALASFLKMNKPLAPKNKLNSDGKYFESKGNRTADFTEVNTAGKQPPTNSKWILGRRQKWRNIESSNKIKEFRNNLMMKHAAMHQEGKPSSLVHGHSPIMAMKNFSALGSGTVRSELGYKFNRPVLSAVSSRADGNSQLKWQINSMVAKNRDLRRARISGNGNNNFKP